MTIGRSKRQRPGCQYALSSAISVIVGPSLGWNLWKTPASCSRPSTVLAAAVEAYSRGCRNGDLGLSGGRWQRRSAVGPESVSGGAVRLPPAPDGALWVAYVALQPEKRPWVRRIRPSSPTTRAHTTLPRSS